MAHDLLGIHPLGGRAEVLGHMCPGDGCGFPPRAFCPVCLGVGVIDETRLAMWQREENEKIINSGAS